MYLNTFAQNSAPVDMTATDEFESLLTSAAELGLTAPRDVRYVSRNLIANGLRLHFLEWGSPGQSPLILLHGGGQTAHSWDLVSLLLSDIFHVVALDQRGHGDTEWPRDGARTRKPMAADALKLQIAMGFEQPTLIGHSMGGLVAMTLLEENPGVARKLVLVDVGPAPSSKKLKEIAAARPEPPEWDTLDAFIERVQQLDPSRSAEHVMRTARYNIMERSDGKFVSKQDSRRAGPVPSMAAEWSMSFTNDDRRASLYSCPLLIVRGGDSKILGQRTAEEFIAPIPSATLVTVPGAGHNVHTQKSGEFVEVVRPFISS